MITKDITMISTWKYLEEEYVISINFATRLRSGQALGGTITVTAEDVKENDVSSSLVGSSSVAGNVASVLLLENGGERGQFYYLRIVVTTNENRKLEQVVELEIK